MDLASRLKRAHHVFVGKIKAVVADPHPHIDVYFNHSDMSFLKVIVEVRNNSACSLDLSL